MRPNPFEQLPDTVEVGGARVRIDPDFRIGVAIETEMLTDSPDVDGLLRAFYPDGVPQDVEAAADRMIWFYAHTDEAGQDDETPSGSSARWYDFTQDADALLASFQQAYGIDLERDSLHWWKFRRLLFGLPPETPFMQRVHYRVADLDKLPKEQRRHYRKMRRLYALRQPERRKMTAAERDAAMKARVQRRFEEAQHAAQGKMPVLRV
ncbi:Gp15 family bacteriophage protein [Agathobaculum sp. Marseille-P7918]|uniref:Gp15 family bacteriophage protein n=1 Tax=Agathobaculum sp. Marseille-P7918 TaxID=2479843 RepID=UPI0013DE0285|nr:Gp15 family bacteriophage protein [Agathobaculum sp. Marseille-P7918]